MQGGLGSRRVRRRCHTCKELFDSKRYRQSRRNGKPPTLSRARCLSPCRQNRRESGTAAFDLYQISESLTLRRFTNQLGSDSTWRTVEVRHGGSDSVARGFQCVAAARFGEKDEGRPAGSAAFGSCGGRIMFGDVCAQGQKIVNGFRRP